MAGHLSGQSLETLVNVLSCRKLSFYTPDMKTPHPSDRLRSILDFMLNFPSREQLIVFLSENVCPYGEAAGVCTGTLGDLGEIKFGFSHGFIDAEQIYAKVNIAHDDPTAETFRTMKTKMINLHRIYENFSQAVAPAGITDYGTGVGFPATSRRIYIFAFVDEQERFQSHMEYFETLRSILTFWEALYDSKINKESSKPVLRDKSLTPRQENILKMVNEGKTNALIASQLGYSESLIRQETIIIYRKLGVEGRRELKREMAS